MYDSLVNQLQAWKQFSQFASPSDWLFASPVQLGRLPWSYDQIWRVYQKAAPQGRHRKDRNAHDASHLSELVGLRWNLSRGAAETDAPR